MAEFYVQGESEFLLFKTEQLHMHMDDLLMTGPFKMDKKHYVHGSVSYLSLKAASEAAHTAAPLPVMCKRPRPQRQTSEAMGTAGGGRGGQCRASSAFTEDDRTISSDRKKRAKTLSDVGKQLGGAA